MNPKQRQGTLLRGRIHGRPELVDGHGVESVANLGDVAGTPVTQGDELVYQEACLPTSPTSLPPSK